MMEWMPRLRVHRPATTTVERMCLELSDEVLHVVDVPGGATGQRRSLGCLVVHGLPIRRRQRTQHREAIRPVMW